MKKITHNEDKTDKQIYSLKIYTLQERSSRIEFNWEKSYEGLEREPEKTTMAGGKYNRAAESQAAFSIEEKRDKNEKKEKRWMSWRKRRRKHSRRIAIRSKCCLLRDKVKPRILVIADNKLSYKSVSLRQLGCRLWNGEMEWKNG